MRFSRSIRRSGTPNRSSSVSWMERRSGSFLGLALAVVLAVLTPAAVDAGIKVDILYDQKADFGAFRTYRWVTTAPDTPEGRLVDQQIKETLAAELAPKGLRPAVEGQEPDLLLTYYGYVEDDLLIEGVRYELAPHVVWTGAAPMDVTRSSRVGTLIVDFADAATETVVWSGVVHGRARDVAKLRDKIAPALRKLLRRYPPE